MHLPRMTTRQLIVAIVVLAVWFAFVARARRLRGIGNAHMQEYASQTRNAANLRDQGQAAEAKALAARYLKSAQEHNVEADFVESFTFTLLLTALFFVSLVILRNSRKRPQPLRAASQRSEDNGPSARV
ncbi:MAG: hypothetical protein P4L84_25035 [Isosphaeraceae bacterium]|nr:hypothetical protein [Isosphaeraceae bacterium]